ncbi:hypothetical protein LCGC14_0146240 [marine sediment metagenome]|uniref:DUF1653 domain-containing protein n=1 Tax=marine sediment metagenome TaxID=412755 RepID=A0A0F9Y1F4_9ZZZZ
MLHLVEEGSVYRHFKGGIYRVLYKATHSETNELMVVYVTLSNEDKENWSSVWVRPADMFYGEVEPGVKRFTQVKNLKEYEKFLKELGEETG